MILVIFDRPEFEYDVHSLVKAFFPKEEVEQYYSCGEDEEWGRNLACTRREIGADFAALLEEASHSLCVFFAQGRERNLAAELLAPRAASREEIFPARLQEEADGKQRISLVWRTKGREQKERSFWVDAEDRRGVKNALKQNLYDMLKACTGQELPWGTLTGIRPTKIPMKLLEEGVGEEAIASYMRETYLASDKKIALSIEIAARERALLSRLDYENGYSLYIGIPFCPTTCLYCSFTSYPLAVWRERVDDYLDALEREIDFTAERMDGRKVNSVYIGGGTPSTLSPRQLERLIQKIRSAFDLSDCLEFTVEAGRPDSVTKEKLLALRENGIGRISINPQTMKQETLDLIGRRHTVEQTVESFRLARELGFDNINMDLILGLPQEDLADVRHTMEELKKLDPDNITVHSLAVKRAARLSIFKDYYKDMQMVNTQAHMELCEDYCRSMGMAPYYLYRQKGMAGNMENVGYAKPGKAGVYNILIMEEKQTIMALGAGATTKFVLPEKNPDGSRRIVRVENVKDVKNYLERIDEMIERKRRKMEEIGWH